MALDFSSGHGAGGLPSISTLLASRNDGCTRWTGPAAASPSSAAVSAVVDGVHPRGRPGDAINAWAAAPVENESVEACDDGAWVRRFTTASETATATTYEHGASIGASRGRRASFADATAGPTEPSRNAAAEASETAVFRDDAAAAATTYAAALASMRCRARIADRPNQRTDAWDFENMSTKEPGGVGKTSTEEPGDVGKKSTKEVLEDMWAESQASGGGGGGGGGGGSGDNDEMVELVRMRASELISRHHALQNRLKCGSRSKSRSRSRDRRIEKGGAGRDASASGFSGVSSSESQRGGPALGSGSCSGSGSDVHLDARGPQREDARRSQDGCARGKKRGQNECFTEVRARGVSDQARVG